MDVITSWRAYPHGYWRRIGAYMECEAWERKLPRSYAPAEPAEVFRKWDAERHQWAYRIKVRIKGWSAS